MTGAGLQSTYTTEFQQAFHQETQSLLRRRFAQYCLVMLGVLVLRLASVALDLATNDATQWADVGAAIIGVTLGILWFGGLLGAVWFGLVKRERLSDLTVWTFIGYGVIVMVVETGAAMDLPRDARSPAAFITVGLVVAHLLAAVVLPWSPRQAARPIVAIALLALLLTVLAPSRFSRGFDLALVAISPLFGMPGLFVAWLKFGRRMERFRGRFFQARYGQMRRELTDARRIHEGVFPERIRDGLVRMDYRYEPMHQIGGDYLYASEAFVRRGRADASLNVVLIDVTGHGVAAALTVNRLHGEVERLFAENPGAGPGEVLRALNRYVQLTLARHSVYATALCVRIDAEDAELHYASGGHPPAFLQGVDATIERLDSTAYVLGACADEDFDPGEERRTFGPGDRLLAYTDGAIEARDITGRMLGIEGLERLLASEPNISLDTIMRHVERFREGPSLDDVLVVEVRRELGPVRTRADRRIDTPARQPTTAAASTPDNAAS